jgi:hypothetical protein
VNRFNHFIIFLILGGILLFQTLAYGTGIDGVDRIPEGIYHYLEQSERGDSQFEWRISYPGDLFEISVDSKEYKTFNRCRPDGETIFWSATSSDGLEVSAERQNDVLIVTQTSEEIQKTIEYAIDDRSWYQPLSYSLRELLSSERKSAEFW